MNDNDAMLTELATAESGSTVENNAPNAGSTPGSFDLVLEGAAGHSVGNSGRPYTLSITAIDLTAGNHPTGTNSIDAFSGTQQFQPTKWVSSGPEFTTNQTFTIPVPGAGAGGPLSGHTLQYVASLVSQDHQIVSIIQSDPFVLV